ncbi:hypothetical protein GQ600_13290 [Phytophthora cactorum]|nr:hypothetical protein GQ600_13290 [Phytophthora cactorum]
MSGTTGATNVIPGISSADLPTDMANGIDEGYAKQAGLGQMALFTNPQEGYNTFSGTWNPPPGHIWNGKYCQLVHWTAQCTTKPKCYACGKLRHYEREFTDTEAKNRNDAYPEQRKNTQSTSEKSEPGAVVGLRRPGEHENPQCTVSEGRAEDGLAGSVDTGLTGANTTTDERQRVESTASTANDEMGGM